jgi:SH3-like domain-containing protein
MNGDNAHLRPGPFLIFAAIFATTFAIVFLSIGGGWAAPAGSGLPLPRFVSLRAQEVNMRAGPGVQYPVEWVYKRRYLPVEIIAEYQTWRKVRDWQGTQGWMHQSMLGGRRSVIVTGTTRTLRAEPDVKSRAIARMEPGVIGKLEKCPAEGGWCRVEIDGRRGWLRRVEFWGVQSSEAVE